MGPDLRVVRGAGQTDAARVVNIEADMSAEAAVLANVLLDPTMLDAIQPFLRPDHFYSEAHRRIYEAACALSAEGKPFDVVLVSTWLRDHERLAQVGGIAYVTHVLNASPACTPSQTIAYARHVRDRWVRRQIDLEAQRMRGLCESDPSVEEILLRTRDRLDVLGEELGASEQTCEVRELLGSTLRALADGTAHGHVESRCRSGFDRLDRLTGGLPAELRVLGGRPSGGKTTLASAFAFNVARQGFGVFFATSETPRRQLLERVLAAAARVSYVRIRDRTLTAEDWARLTPAANELSKHSLWFDDDANFTATSVAAKARRAKLHLRRQGRELGLIVVDHLQRLRPPSRGMPRDEALAESTRALAALAIELGCCVLLLSQLNREYSKRPDHRPLVTDLHGSGAIEQNARTVLLLTRDDGEAHVHVAKQNDGPEGARVPLGIEAECLRFFDVDEGEPSPLCPGCGLRRPAADGKCSACSHRPRAAEDDRSLFPAGFAPDAQGDGDQ